jgi:hypothetical protein
MPLNEFQRAFLINGLIEKAQVIDPATGAPLDWGALGGSSDATAVTFTPVGNIAATNVAAALAELDTEKQPVDSDLTAIAALSTTSFGRALLASPTPRPYERRPGSARPPPRTPAPSMPRVRPPQPRRRASRSTQT